MTRPGRQLIAATVVVALGLSFCVEVSASTSSSPTPPEGAAAEEFVSLGAGSVDVVRGRHLVQYPSAAALSRGMSDLRVQGMTPTRVATGALNVVSVDATPAEVAQLRRDPAVIAVEPEQLIESSAQQVAPPWGLDRIDERMLPLDGLYQYAYTGAGVSAYVIDSGLWLSHNEFTGRVLPGAYWDFGDGFGPWDCYGHGTHVAGILGGTTYGVAKSVSIVPVRALDCDGDSSSSIIISAANWVVGNHQAGTPAIVNMSLGGPPSNMVDAAVQAMVDDGITVIAAAGNESINSCFISPARIPALITVGATEIDDDIAGYSNFGTCNDIFAPGTGILSAYLGSDSASATFNGTSMAAPHVAGAAALVLEAHPSYTAGQVWSTINADATVGALNESNGSPDKLLFIPSPPRTLSVATSGSGNGSVTSNPAGIVCGGDCSEAYPASTTVTLWATPAAGSVFVGWTGDCSGNGTCTLPMVNDRAVDAEFAPSSSDSSYIPISPARLLDSRPGKETVDGLYAGIGLRTAGSVTELVVTGRSGALVLADAEAVALNVTVVAPATGGFATIFPCGSGGVPIASNLNFRAGVAIANAAVVKVGGAGKVCIFTTATTHVVVDINGWFPNGSSFTPLPPERPLDTRSGARPAGGSVTEVTIADFESVPADATTAVLNVTAVNPAANGFVTAFPCGSPIPNSSNVNYTAGVNIANAVVAKIGQGGKVCLYTSASTHLLADLGGYYREGSDYVALDPARLLDSRPGHMTADGQQAGIGARSAGSVTVVSVGGRVGVQPGAAAVVLNLTVVTAAGPGFATAYPCNAPSVPNSSNVNFLASATIPNAVIVKLPPNGTVCVYTSATTHLLVDVGGYFET